MEWHQLRCFLAAADDLHFGRAAQRLHMLPSALGRHIRLLEQDLGTQLFARTTRAVSLTEDGSTLVGEARALLDQVEAIERRYREKRRRQENPALQDRRDGQCGGRTASAAHGGCPCEISGYRDPVAGGEDDQAVAEDPFRRARSCVRSAAGAAGQAPRIQTAVSGKRASWPFRRNIPLRGANPFR